MSFKIKGWREGHPHLTKIDNYPFGYSQRTNPNPLLATNCDGYASSFNELYNRYRRKATEKGREFTLTKQEFYELTSQPCFYCAAPPSQTVSKRVKNSYIYNGIDRDDSDKGYIHGNCLPCCWKHNDLKGKLSFEEFYRQSLAVVLSVLSRTALSTGDLQCLEFLTDLFPNVRFLKEHHSALQKNLRRNPQMFRYTALSKK